MAEAEASTGLLFVFSDKAIDYILLFLLCVLIGSAGSRKHSLWTRRALLLAVCFHLHQRCFDYDVPWGNFVRVRWIMRVYEKGDHAPVPEQPLQSSPEPALLHSGIPSAENEMNVTRCIELHNQIVEYVLERVMIEDVHRKVRKNWFTFWGAKADAARQHLSPPITVFLENIYAWNFDDLSLTPQIPGVSMPEWTIPALEPYGGNVGFYEDFPNGFILYRSNERVELLETLGLVFDMSTNLVHWYSEAVVPRRSTDKWYPLETALEFYWSEIQRGRYLVSDKEPLDPMISPARWREEYVPAYDLQRTLKIWDLYVDLVEFKMGTAAESQDIDLVQRMQSLSTSSSAEIPERGLVSTKLLEEYGIDGFAGTILSRMRKPNFTFAAPGLRILDNEHASQTFPIVAERRRMATDYYDANGDEHSVPTRIPPPTILLLYSDVRAGDAHPDMNDNQKGTHDWRRQSLLDDRCGVYVGTEFHASPDEVVIVAPMKRQHVHESVTVFHDQQGIIRTSLSDVEYEDKVLALTGDHYLRLHNLIAIWYDKVVSGEWSVTVDGVGGDLGEEIWKATPDAKIYWLGEDSLV